MKGYEQMSDDEYLAWWNSRPLCDICNDRITGSHYHCGNCKSPELTSQYGHYAWGTFHCEERRRQYEERVKRTGPFAY